MSRSYQNFVFKSYHFDAASKTLKLQYGFDDELTFTETYTFDFPFAAYDSTVLDKALQDLFFMAGVSYYKAYPSEQIRVDHGKLSRHTANFFSETYQKGLGEYFYVNKLDPNTDIPFLHNAPDDVEHEHTSNGGQLVAIGGGKDSLVTVELLRNQPNVATWSLGHRSQMTPLINVVGLKHFWVERNIDPLLLELNNQDALNGHIPISAIFSCVGTVVAVLSGYRDTVVSNENSSNEPTLTYNGVAINHQYSKSLAYEQAYQAHLQQRFGDSLRYYSMLRPYSEVRIAELFSPLFEKYKAVFSSCNRAYVQSSDHMSWCGTCSKCAFTFLALTPFIERPLLEELWHKNLLLEPTLITTYQNLLGIRGDKPLDCVGEIKESRAAMALAQQQYSGLGYEFALPENYDFRAMAPHRMPEEIAELLPTPSE